MNVIKRDWPADAFYAYLHCRPDGTPFYVGKGKLRRAKTLRERNPYHKAVVAKYGKQSIQLVLIRCANETVAYQVEVALIAAYRKNGVALTNFTAGGEGGASPCEETRAKLSAAAKRRGVSEATRRAVSAAKKGVPWTLEQRAALSERMKLSWSKRTLTPEQHANLSVAAKARGMSEATRSACRQAMLGRTFTHLEETKAKMRAAAIGRVIPTHVREAARLARLGTKRPHSEEAKNKMRIKALDRIRKIKACNAEVAYGV